MKVLVATEKPFSKAAVEGIRNIVEEAGYTLATLEKYTDVQQFYDAVADVDALIVRSDKVTRRSSTTQTTLRSSSAQAQASTTSTLQHAPRRASSR